MEERKQVLKSDGWGWELIEGRLEGKDGNKGGKMRRDAYGDGDLSELSDFFHTFFFSPSLSL